MKQKKKMKKNTPTKVIIKTESKENEFVTKCLKATYFFNEPFRLSNEDYIQTDVYIKANDMLQKLLFSKYKHCWCFVQFSKCVIYKIFDYFVIIRILGLRFVLDCNEALGYEITVISPNSRYMKCGTKYLKWDHVLNGFNWNWLNVKRSKFTTSVDYTMFVFKQQHNYSYGIKIEFSFQSNCVITQVNVDNSTSKLGRVRRKDRIEVSKKLFSK